MIVAYTVEAEADLVDIGLYTLEEWDPAQYERYIAMLEETCEQILPRNIKHARTVEQRPGLLRWRADKHIIDFRRIAGGIEIVRVLHSAMLSERHL